MEQAAPAPPPLVQILGSTPKTRSRLGEDGVDPFDRMPPPR
jgi:hypothetical protein